jgi:hypothetical protein
MYIQAVVGTPISRPDRSKIAFGENIAAAIEPVYDLRSA